jgi:hypothetical protein
MGDSADGFPQSAGVLLATNSDPAGSGIVADRGGDQSAQEFWDGGEWQNIKNGPGVELLLAELCAKRINGSVHKHQFRKLMNVAFFSSFLFHPWLRKGATSR